MTKRLLGLLLVLIIIFGPIIYFIPEYRKGLVNLFVWSQCDTPLTYQLGMLDPRFGIDKASAIADISQAANIWNKAEGKNLLEQTQSANLTINFTYDERTALNSQINQMQNKLNQNNSSLQLQIDQHNSDVKAFEQKLADFNATIEKYNSEGGAPPDVYNQLIAEQNQLKQEADSLNAQARQLNLSTQNYNYNVNIFNKDINQFNIEITQKPEEGLYDASTKTINIYFADNHQELVHTLTHELGHSLGLQHVNNPKAIMYPYTTSSLELSPEDESQLLYLCRNQTTLDLVKALIQNAFLNK